MPSRSLTLARAVAPKTYGAYTIIFTEQGFDSKHSSIAKPLNINPMQP
jgi:hypothetical protein